MSDSEFSDSPVQCERPKPKRAKESAKRKSSSATNKSSSNDRSRSDSELSDSPVQCERTKPKRVKEAVKRKTSSATKKSSSNERSRTQKKKAPSSVFDVFNLQDDDEGSGQASSTTASVLYNRVANGQTRRTAFLDGAFHVELKVFHAADVDAGGDDLWKKSLLWLKLRTDDDSPHWDRVQKFVKQASSLFDNSEATFYSNNIKFK